MQLDRPEWGFFEGIETNYRLTFQLPFILAKTWLQDSDVKET